METSDKNLKEIRNDLNKSQLEMAEILGVERGTYLRYEKDNKFPEKKEKVYYDIINSLYDGNNTMIKDDQEIPLYDLEASASVEQIFSDRNDLVPKAHIKIPNLPKCDGAMPIRGDSMYPLLKSGDTILYKIVHDKQNIIWGQMYIVYVNNNGDEFLLTKFLHPSERNGYVKFVSQNTHYAPVEFPMDSIQAIAQVQASIRINADI